MVDEKERAVLSENATGATLSSDQAATVATAANPPNENRADKPGLAVPVTRAANWSGRTPLEAASAGDQTSPTPSKPLFVRSAPLVQPLIGSATVDRQMTRPMPQDVTAKPPAGISVPAATAATSPASEKIYPMLERKGNPTESKPHAAVVTQTPGRPESAPEPAPGPAAEVKFIEIRSQQLEGEMNVLRRELNRLQTAKQSTDQALLESRRSIKDFEQRLAKVKTTVSYQLGSTLVESKKSWSAASKLPGRLFQVYRNSRKLKQRATKNKDAVPASIAQSAEAVAFIQSALTMSAQRGGEHAAAWAKTQNAKPSILAYALIEIARAASSDNPQLAAALGSEALDLYPAEQRVKALAFMLAEQGHIRKAVAVLDKAAIAGATFNSNEGKSADNIRSLARLFESPPLIPERTRSAPKTTHKRVAIFGRESLPFHVSTTALWLHDRALQVETAGWAANVITPPGYPRDIRGRTTISERPQDVGGITYTRLKQIEQAEDVADLHLSAVAASYASAVVAAGARVIQAEGTYLYGVAAALAARSTGCPLVLEFNDLLDPHDSFPIGMERTERGQLQLSLTLTAARAADACVVHHPSVWRFLTGGGVAAENIVLAHYRFPETLPAPDAVIALAQELGLAAGPVIGVVRDLCSSYDNAVLVELLATLAPAFPGLKLLIVGQGRGADVLRKRAHELGLGRSLVLIDKPVPDLIATYRALLDVAVFTRHDTMRASVFSAYELQAALAQGCPVVAYRTPDVVDLVDDGVTGELSSPGDVPELAHRVRILLEKPSERRALGDAARAAYLLASQTSAEEAMDTVFQAVLTPERRLIRG